MRLGETPSGEGLVDLLLACHARIRRHARLALTIGARLELPPGEVMAVATQCLRYFGEALPLHVRDEEDSLAPRLAGKSERLDATLAQMRAQHFAHEVLLDALTEALRAVVAEPASAQHRRRLADAAATLETDLEAHLSLEEAALFPFVVGALSASDQAEAVRELRARRQPAA